MTDGYDSDEDVAVISRQQAKNDQRHRVNFSENAIVIVEDEFYDDATTGEDESSNADSNEAVEKDSDGDSMGDSVSSSDSKQKPKKKNFFAVSPEYRRKPKFSSSHVKVADMSSMILAFVE